MRLRIKRLAAELHIAKGERMMKRLAGQDAMLLYSEATNVAMHTTKVAVIETDDGRPWTAKLVRRGLARHLGELEPLNFVLVETPFGLHHPCWTQGQVDLDYHVRDYRLPAPGSRRELDDAVARISEGILDRGRPLWEIYVVSGLAGGRTAIVAKIHHALADGVASGNLLRHAVATINGSAVPKMSTAQQVPGRTQLVRAAMRDHLHQLRNLPGTVRYTCAAIGRIRRSRHSLSPSIAQPAPAPPTFINHRLAEQRRFATATVPLAEAKEVSRALGCTLNDVVLAIAAGSLRELRLHHDGRSDDPLVASVPVCIDRSPDRLSGNRFTGMLVALPTHIEDPLQRLAFSRQAAGEAKEIHQIMGPDLVNRWFDYLPPTPSRRGFTRMADRDGHNKIYNVLVSNVPGPREVALLPGGRVTEFYSVGPLTAASGVNITVWSYADQLNFSVLADSATVDDAHEITKALVNEFDGLRATVPAARAFATASR